MTSAFLILVLYSKDDDNWKVADFGLTCEGTTRRDNTTRYARGTIGYRSPELTTSPGTFNNKVDIWALGCVLFELAARKKAFDNDWRIMEYAQSAGRSSRPEFPPLSVTQRCQTYLQELAFSMLSIKASDRPNARSVLEAVKSLGEMAPVCLLDNQRRLKPLIKWLEGPDWSTVKWVPFW